MNRNTNSPFSNTSSIDKQRSTFDRSCGLKTTFDSGYLIPIYYEDVLPGDTVTMDTSCVVRMSTPVFPVMDNCNLDLYYFFVPNRLVWEHWKQFCGEADSASSWNNPVNYEVPQLYMPHRNISSEPLKTAFGFSPYSVADYFGLPISGQTIQAENIDNYSVSALPFRAYCLIWNEFFRSQQLQDPVLVPIDDEATIGRINTFETEGRRPTYQDSFETSLNGGDLLPVNKNFDYFTSCLPSPQRGPAVSIPVSSDPLVLASSDISQEDLLSAYGLASPSKLPTYSLLKNDGGKVGMAGVPSNLYADVSVGTLNDLRTAFAIQRFLELESRSGSRYTEVVRSFFGVTSPDSRLQRPEYIGGKQIPINISQVLQTSSTDTTSPQGNASGFSITSDTDSFFTYSATEHGMIIGLACVRPVHTYQNGIDRKWSRKTKFDFYWPTFSNIGEQAVLNREIFFTGGKGDLEAFGYQEAWADYRYGLSHVSGGMRSKFVNSPEEFTSLDVWHYADNYSSLPSLSADWLTEDPALIQRTLAVDAIGQQFIADFWFNSKWTRVMPLASVPGLIDHG